MTENMVRSTGKKNSTNKTSSRSPMERPSARVRELFSDIANDYDFFNHALSLNIDRFWRKKARKILEPHLSPDSQVLDLCTGTGDLVLELQKVSPVTGCDFCRPMLTIADRKINRRKLNHPVNLVEGDGMKLPFASGQFDAVSLAFGFRNMEDYDQALLELNRVISHSGVLMILDFSKPDGFFFRRIYLFYLTRVLPLAGKLISGIISPYNYLPDSVKAFPEKSEMEKKLVEAGFQNQLCQGLTFGITTIYLARKD
jgi:demethylmenaquinone methyltransferase / 2-methoxy-6-polyprenyl-1,4-benzoquinol methylase